MKDNEAKLTKLSTTDLTLPEEVFIAILPICVVQQHT